MNYTKPNDLDHKDSPNDWLMSALIFARALSAILSENEGVVIDLVGDMKFTEDLSVDKVIVFYSENMTRIIPCEDDNLSHGTRIMMIQENPN